MHHNFATVSQVSQSSAKCSQINWKHEKGQSEYSLSLHFNGHFPGGPGLASVY